ncbi:hypothetical protein [Parabacteroides sp.]|uniref:hypothetical protein n=1 Tax=Parabacteroides sp. TaxID=1869337 RepID=UPI0026DEAF0D|nr:hypothetical protein [Parabacteroides sp.]MDO5430210.1 hypothetical protein [Parabacteroides sp.]
MTDEDIYMTDGSYEEVYSGTSPRKVSYASSDHSAVTTDQDGWFISKWANRLLMRHRYDDCPFNSTSLRYYIKSSLFKMEGNTSICNGGTNGYSINYQPKNPITWSVSSGLQIVSGQGTTSVIVKATTSSKTQGSITVKFGKKTISKSISINGVDVASITGPTQVKLNTTQTYTANPNYWFDNMDWRWEVATSVYPKPMYSTINSQLTVSFTQEGSYTLRCWVQSPCGVSTGTGYLYVMVGRYYSVQLDPQINLLSISKNDDFISGYNLLPKALCTYELISVERGVIVSSGTFNADNGLSTYVNNLSKGAYVLKITSGDGKIETHKLNY